MANTPIQVPNVALPGAEFFALAPGRTVAMGPRLFAGNATAPVIAVPATTIGGANQSGVIEPNWGTSSGIFLVRAYGLFVPADTSGSLTVIAARMGLGTAPLAIGLDIGLPTATFASPAIAQIVIYERDALITSQDLPNQPQNSPLSIILQMQVKNTDAANPHSFQFGFSMVWHRLNGFVQ